VTRAEFLSGLLVTVIAPTLKADRHDTEPLSFPIDPAERPVTVRLTDFIKPEASDASDGFLAFIDAINASTATRIVGLVPAGVYRLDAARLLQVAPIIARDGVTLCGEGKPTIRLNGAPALPALIRFRNCTGRVKGIAFVGNGQGSGYTNGSAIQFLVDSAATRSTAFMEVIDCDFDNFRSPSWIYGFVSHHTFGIDRVLIANNSVVSRPGNSINPDALGMRSAAFLLQSKADPRHGGGGIRNIHINDNVVDASHIKSGIFLSDRIERCTIARNRVIGAGIEGASDNAGGYAFAAYDSDGLGMRGIVFKNNIVDGVRSAGIYCAGLADATIDHLTGHGQIDLTDATLPKGLIVLNGVTRFDVGNVVADAIGDTAVYVVPDPSGTIGTIHDVEATRCRNAIYLVSALGTSTIRVDGLRARACLYGILGNLVDGGAARTWTLTRLDIASAVPGSDGVRIFSEGSAPVYPTLQIGGSSVIETAHAGVVISQIRASRIGIDGITFRGSFSSAGIDADGAHGLMLDNLVFDGQAATGYAMRLAGARGSVGKAITMRNIAPGYTIAGDAELRLGAPVPSVK
jgi:hypothetical protein